MIPREIQVGKDVSFSVRYFTRAIAVVPTVAKVTIFDNSGITVQIESDATIAADGTISIVFLAANNIVTGNNYKIVYSIDGKEKAYLFDVAKYEITNEVSDDDLFAVLPELKTKIFDYSGVATEDGDPDALIDTNLIAAGRVLVGGFVAIYISETVEHNAQIIAYDAEAGRITFAPEYADDILAETRYSLRDSYSDLISKAFERVRSDIRRRVRLAAGYIDNAAAKDLVVYRALYMYSFAAIEAEGDKWSIRTRGFQDQYDAMISSFGDPYDTDGDGNISDRENTERPSFRMIEARR